MWQWIKDAFAAVIDTLAGIGSFITDGLLWIGDNLYWLIQAVGQIIRDLALDLIGFGIDQAIGELTECNCMIPSWQSYVEMLPIGAMDILQALEIPQAILTVSGFAICKWIARWIPFVRL